METLVCEYNSLNMHSRHSFYKKTNYVKTMTETHLPNTFLDNKNNNNIIYRFFQYRNAGWRWIKNTNNPKCALVKFTE